MSVRCPRKRDSRYSWLVCVGASISNGMAHSVVFGFGVLMPVFMKEFNQSREKTALLGSLTFGVALYLSLLSGKVCHRFGCRLSNIIGTLSCAASLFITSWVTGMTYLYFSLCLLYGLGLSFTFMSCFLIVSTYFEKHRSVAIGIVAAGASAGFFLMGPVMEALLGAVGWRNALRTLSGLLLCTCFISILFDPNIEMPEQNASLRSTLERDDEPNTIKGRLVKSLSFIRLPRYIVPVISYFVVSFSHISVPIHFVRHCQEIGISNKRSSYLYVGLGLGSFVFRVAAGKLCEFVNPVYVYQVGCFCSGIVTLVLSMTSSYSVLVVITLIYGMADGVFFTTFNVIVLSVVEHEQRPYAYACANTAASVAFTLGPMITGMVADHHSYREAFIMAGTVTIIGALVPLFLHCFKVQQQPREQVEKLLVYEKVTVV